MSHDLDLAQHNSQRRIDSGAVISLQPAQSRFFERASLDRDLLNALPAAIYTTDAEGRINFYNEAAVTFAGRRPALGELWCVTWRLYDVHGARLAHEDCPMAIALKEGRPVRGVEAVAERPDGTRVTFMPYPTPLFDHDGRLVGAVNMLVDITDRRAAEERQRLLAHEVNHRANNLLSVLQSIVRITTGPDVEAYRSAISGRIEALARAHSLLAKSRWVEADLQPLVSEELAPFMGDQTRAWLGGRPLPLKPAAAQALAMIIHELATNAAKYGALSTEEGRIQVDWRTSPKGDLILRWREEGGPAAAAPTKRGVGSTVIARAAAQLGAVVKYDWGERGLSFEFRGPAGEIVQSELA
jgi:PAS domain S-box-containing protein